MITRVLILVPVLLITSVLKSQNVSSYGVSSGTISYNSIFDESPSFFTWPATTLYDDDYLSNATNIGFNFTYNGIAYSQLKASVNGFITFNLSAQAVYEDASNGIEGSYSNNPFQFYESTGSLNVIAPFYTDLLLSTYIAGNNSDVNSAVAYKLTGSSPNRVFTVEWKDCLYSTGGIANFQVKLYESDQRIEFLYGNIVVVPSVFESKTISPITGINGATIATSYQPQSSEVLNLACEFPFEFSNAITQLRNSYPDTNLLITFRNNLSPCNVTSLATNLTFPSVSHTSLQGNFRKSNHILARYYVLRTTTNTAPTYSYNIDSAAYQFDAALVYDGNDTTFIDTELLDNTTYYYWVYTSRSFNCSGAKPAIGAIPLSASTTTLNCTGPSGIFNVGPTGTYTSLTAAFNSLRLTGLGGPITLELEPAYSPSVETYPIVIDATIPCINTDNRILIRPKSTVTSAKVFTSATSTSILRIQNTSFITIDGRPGGVGTNKYLTFQNTDTLGAAVELLGNSNDNLIQFCTLVSTNRLTNEGTLVFNNLCTNCETVGLNNNTIIYCDFNPGATNPVNAIYAKGAQNATEPIFSNQYNAIRNCNIRDYFLDRKNCAGIYLDLGNSNWTIQKNSFFQTVARNYPSAPIKNHYDIYIASGFGHNIRANSIGGTASLTNGSQMNLSGYVNYASIYVSQFHKDIIANGSITEMIAYNATKVDSNYIQNMKLNTTTENSIMDLNYGNYEVGVSNSNYIGGTAATDSIVVYSSGEFNAIRLLNVKEINIRGNRIYNILLTNIFASFNGIVETSSVNYRYIINRNYRIEINRIGNTSIYGIKCNASLYGIKINSNAALTEINSNDLTLEATGTSDLYAIYNPNSTSNITYNDIVALRGNASITGIYGGGQIFRNTLLDFYSTNNIGYTYIRGVDGYFAKKVEKNTIANLTVGTSNGNPTITAIYSGTALVSNNVIRLGYDNLGMSNNTNVEIYGIQSSGGDIYYNSVFIGGNTTSTKNCYILSATNGKVFNNIFFNNRSNSGTGFCYLLKNQYIQGIPDMNHNLYYFSGTNTRFAINESTVINDFYGWKLATGRDLKSGFFNPNFLNPTVVNFSLNLVSPTPAESIGLPIDEVASDYNFIMRNSKNPDAGMQEINGTSIDVVPPTISFTKLATQCGTGIRTLFASISDSSGIYSTGAKRPRIYYNKNNGTYSNRAGVFVSGNTKNGIWSFTILSADMGGVANGDIVEYFVVAQDSSVQQNLTSSPFGAVGTETSILTSYPPDFTYMVSTAPAMAGNYNIGAGQTFGTINAAFTAYNNGCLTDHITFSLKDSIYNIVTDTIKFNQTASSESTLTLKPTKLNTVITGNSAGAVVVLNGAQYVNIDGSFNANIVPECSPNQGNRNMTIRNINSGINSSVVQFTDATLLKNYNYCGIRNCIILGNGNQTKNGIFLNKFSNLNTSSNITLQNNVIGACQIGIEAAGNSTQQIDSLEILKNQLDLAQPNNIKQFGIVVTQIKNSKINHNSINHIRRNDSKDVAGILLGFASTSTIQNISNGTSNSILDSEVNNNTIDSVIQTNGLSAVGIVIAQSSAPSRNLIANNMISHVLSNCTGNEICMGILIGNTTTDAFVDVYNNTVHMQGLMEGTIAATGYSSCFGFNGSLSTSNLNLKNNIFVNTQRGNAGANLKFSSMGFLFTSRPSNVLSNYNDLYASGTGPGTYTLATSGGFSTGTNRITLGDWQSFSIQDSVSLNMLPSFIAHNDLRLLNAPVNAPLDNSALPITNLTTDVDCEFRSTTIPDRGADEFVSCKFNLANDIAGVMGLGIEARQDVSSSNIFYYECEPLASVIPFGLFPVTGNVTAKVYLSDTALFYGLRPLGQRYFEITPKLFPNIATGFVVLYFKQADFNAYNAANGNYLELPKDRFDTLAIKNLRIMQMHGSSSNGSPNNYSGQAVEIDPINTLIQWNSKLQAWVIGFPVSGFSGFYLSSAAPTCRTSNIKLTTNLIGSAYQWQVNTGSGYANIANGGVYSGVTNDTLTIASPATTFRGYKYRCVVNGANGQESELLFSLKWVGNTNVNWGNAANWGCSTVPDVFTDVLIDSGPLFQPTVNVNAFARTLKLNAGVQLQINAPRTLRVEH